METVMVQMSDERWTKEAVHLACALARKLNGRVVLLRLSPAIHPGLLGWGITPPSADEQRRVTEYAEIAEDYGLEFCVQPMQFVSLDEALAQTVELLQATVLFANIPLSNIPFWRHFRLWNLKRQLGGCRLYTLVEEAPLSTTGSTSPTMPLGQH